MRDDEFVKYKSTLRRIQNERKIGFGHYILLPKKFALMVGFFFFLYFLTGAITGDGFFRFSLSLLGTLGFFFLYYYPNYPEEYYRKEESLQAIFQNDKIRKEKFSELKKKLPSA